MAPQDCLRKGEQVTMLQQVMLLMLAVAALASRAVTAQQGGVGKAEIVTTAQELIHAMDSGVEHVHVTAHLDLRHQRGSLSSDDFYLFNTHQRLKSLTVRHWSEAMAMCCMLVSHSRTSGFGLSTCLVHSGSVACPFVHCSSLVFSLYIYTLAHLLLDVNHCSKQRSLQHV
jgi:hypothetical protein